MDSSVASLVSLSSDGYVRQPFRFFDLPSELRLRIYELVLVVKPGNAVDLDPSNYRTIAPRLSCLHVCRQMHFEAYHVFYGTPQQPLRLYPVHGRFFHTKKPLLTRIGARYRGALNSLEIRLGPGWAAPPRCWHTGPVLGLEDCTSLRTLKVLVQTDPSDPFFDGFRGKGNGKYTYQDFCITLLQGIVAQVPSLETIELDALRIETITKASPLIQAVVAEARRAGKRLTWGPVRGWDQVHDIQQTHDMVELAALENAIAALGLGTAPA